MPGVILHEDQKLRARTSGERFLELDALRGLAAVTVVIGHSRFILTEAPVRRLEMPFFAATQSVILFFVLSGFVLSLSYWTGHAKQYGVFVIRRVIRIYFPFAVASALSIAGDGLFYRMHPSLSPWAATTWNGPVTLSLAAKQFLMPLSGNFNVALWSLRYEMELSLVFPLMILVMQKVKPAVVAGLLLVLAFGPLHHLPLWPHWCSVLALRVAALFAIGAALAHAVPVIRKYSGIHPFARLALLGAALFLYYAFQARAGSGYMWFSSAIGAVILIACSFSIAPLARLLRSSPLEYLGRISYSLYLTHSIVLFALFCLLYGRIPLPLLYGAVGLLALVTAHLFCVWVEEPCIRLQKRVRKWWGSGEGGRPAASGNQPPKVSLVN